LKGARDVVWAASFHISVQHLHKLLGPGIKTWGRPGSPRLCFLDGEDAKIQGLCLVAAMRRQKSEIHPQLHPGVVEEFRAMTGTAIKDDQSETVILQPFPRRPYLRKQNIGGPSIEEVSRDEAALLGCIQNFVRRIASLKGFRFDRSTRDDDEWLEILAGRCDGPKECCLFFFLEMGTSIMSAW
jgi:hypothetical protein